MTFSCTVKALSKLKRLKSVSIQKTEISLSNWYVDLITLERKKYCLFTNSKTLFSFIMYVGTKKEIQNLETLFIDKLKEQIARAYGLKINSDKYVNVNCGSFVYNKTNSRSILGSMNDFKLNIKSNVDNNGLTINSINSINHY